LILEEQIASILSGLQSAITDLAPEAWALLVRSAFIDGIRGAAIGVMCGGWVLYYASKLPRTVKAIAATDEEMEAIPKVIFCIAGGFATIVCSIAFFEVGMDLRTWLGIIHPEAVVVRDLLSAARP
jgi:hypothetical protein